MRIRLLGAFLLGLAGAFPAVSLSGDGYLHISGKSIVDGEGDPVLLRGMGLGGWLVPEGYQLHVPGFGSPSDIEKKVEDLVGEEKAGAFWALYRKRYVSEADMAAIASWGFNSIRLPFNYRLLVTEDPSVTGSDSGFAVIDRVVEWCKTYGLYLILDMHCAPGGQNKDNISDSDGIEARLWTEPANQDRIVEIWTGIARRYAGETCIAGYDLINEPVLPQGMSNSELRGLYMRLVRAIREVDPNHIVFIEGNWYATDFSLLTPPFDGNMVYSFHKYWNENSEEAIRSYLDIRKDYRFPLWMGESGENANTWFFDCVQLLENNDIGWCWWTHKKVQTLTSPFSAPLPSAYQRILDYWNGQGQKPDPDQAFAGLMQMAENLHMDSCAFRPGVLDALFRSDFNQNTLPVKTHAIPGIVAAADYDLGREGLASHDADYENIQGPGGGVWNRGWQYRNDGVDIEESEDPDGADYSVGWIETGEWMNYTVQVEKQDDYRIRIRFASADGGGILRLRWDGRDISGPVPLPATGGWKSWAWKDLPETPLSPGAHTLRVEAAAGGFNLELLRIDSSGTAVPGDGSTNPDRGFRIYPNYPNPFNSTTRIPIDLSRSSHVELDIFNMQGQRVASLHRGECGTGYRFFEWDGRNDRSEPVASGLYMVRWDVDGWVDGYPAVLQR